ncbi:MAG: chloride channel protein [Bacteroidales bacterium]|nr:MAG: chloride channel protein [Bacteroidales bacterium]
MKRRNLLARFLVWRVKHINHRQFIYLLSFIVGIISGLAAILLKNTIHYTHLFLTRGFDIDSASYLYLAYPLFGIFLTVLFVRYIVKDNISHGVARILYAISKKNSILKPHNNYSSILASTITIGFGGSVGSEAPIVLTGASIGSSIGRLLRLNYKSITLLVGCGAAGAIAGIFKAPVAGIVFTLEVLMLDLTIGSIVPLLISSVTGATIAFFLMGKEVLFSHHLTEPFILNNIPFYILLGIFAGLLSLYFTRATMYIESMFGRLKNPYMKLVVGGVLLGLLIFLFPPLYGEGYTAITALLNGDTTSLVENSLFYLLRDKYWMFLVYLAMVMIFKVLAMSATTGGGGVGGIFAPTLFMGGVTGFFFARVINGFDVTRLTESNFTLAGMAGLMAGVMHAPLTAIFLIAEITGGYGLLVPLIITSTISFMTIMYFEPHSIYTKRLAKRGELITHHKDKAVLTLMKWEREIEKDLKTIHPDKTLRSLVKLVSKSKRNLFPVTDDENRLVGVVLLDNIRDIMFNNEMYDNTFVRDLMIIPPAFVLLQDSMETVMERFNESGAWNLPVIDEGKYVGFISKSRIFSAYRKELVRHSEE